MRRGFVTAALLTLASALCAAPAQSTVREKFRFQDSWSYTEDCGFPVEVAGSSHEMVVLREGKNKDAGAFPVLNKFSYSETWTNPDTGAWFLIRGKVTFNEVTATRIDGSIFEFRARESGQPFVVEDSDGNVVVRNSGTAQISYLFDTLGDTEPGGEFLIDTGFRLAGPHPSISVEPCQYAVQLIG